MSWRVNKSERVGAFKRGQHDLIERNIQALAERYCGLQKLELNGSDLLEMFIEPEMREPAKEAYKRFSVNTLSTVNCPFSLSPHEHGVVHLTPRSPLKWARPAEFNHAKPFYVNSGASGYRRLLEWAEWRVEAGLKWGLVMAVYNHLCAACADPKTLRYLWPAVVPLLGHDEMADKLRVPKAPSFIPTMSMELRTAIADTNALVAGTLMVPKPKHTDDLPVDVRLEVSNHTAKRPWDGGKYHCL